MKDDVKICLESRVEFFGKYCIVPDAMRDEVDSFCRALTKLAEESADAASFESEFVSQGYSQQFNKLVTSCSPKAYEMTDEDKARVKDVKKELRSGKDIAKTVASDVFDSVAMEAESEMYAKRREFMVENETFDDYTRATNAVDNAVGLGKLLGKLFKKKK